MPPPTECRHGVKVYWTKLGDDGQVSHAWKCPGERGDQCSYTEGAFEFHNQ